MQSLTSEAWGPTPNAEMMDRNRRSDRSEGSKDILPIMDSYVSIHFQEDAYFDGMDRVCLCSM